MLIGNERIRRLLERAVAEGRVGQSLLMAGPRGVGKYTFAIALAQALNCERAVEGARCTACASCLRIERGEHADVRTILRESKDPSLKKEQKSQFIKIDQIRVMCEQAQFRPYEGRHRVFIIDEAEWLRHEAANCLLKTLEEPPSTTLIILITSKPYALLDTIRSRCLPLNFAPLTPSEIETHLAKKNLPAEEARLRARLARGSIGIALEIDLDKYRQERERMLEIVEGLALRRAAKTLLDSSEYLGRRIDKEDFERHLDIWLVLLADLCRLKLGAPPESLTNADIAKRLESLGGKITLDRIAEWLDTIEDIFRALPRNINRHLALDSIFTAHLTA